MQEGTMGTRKMWIRATFYVVIAVIGMLVVPYSPLPSMSSWTDVVSYAYGGYEEEKWEPPNYIDPGQGKTARDPETPWVSVIFLKGAVSKPVEVRAYETGQPEVATPPPSTLKLVRSLFFFGAWVRGEGVTADEFNFPVGIEVSYAGKTIRQPEAREVSESEEKRLALYTYDPVNKVWIKLPTEVDPYRDVATGWVRYPKRIDTDNGNSLLALFVDEPCSLEQTVDNKGVTTISCVEKGISLRIPPGTVAVGSFFDITSIPSANAPSAGPSLKPDNPIANVQAWDDTKSEINKLPKSIGVDIDRLPGDSTKAGSKANLTIVTLKDGPWIDVEDLGYTVTRGEKKITVDTDRLGVFAPATQASD
jgi:hypothetical protein